VTSVSERSEDRAGRAAAEKDRIITLLGDEWRAIAELLGMVPDDAWSRPALPGWDVHDVLAHLVGSERMLAGAERPVVQVAGDAGPHVKNSIARLNEEWVMALRSRSHTELLGDFRAVTTERLAALRAMSPDDFAAPSWTPVGDATYGRFMEIRVFDAWMHEQDIRVAAGVPGHEVGPVAEQALAEVVGALGYIVGKLGGAPQGSSVTIRLEGPIERDLHVVVDERARVVEGLPAAPTASIALSSSLFLRLAGGRVDPASALGRVELGGDTTLAHRLVTHLAYTL